jgi:histidine ammonia-lyase
VEAFATLDRVLSVEMNAAAENPLVDAPTGQVLHNGNFQQGPPGMAFAVT